MGGNDRETTPNSGVATGDEPRRFVKVFSFLLIFALLSLPRVPPSSAQDDTGFPTTGEQKDAAEKLLEQLDDVGGTVDPSTLTIDPDLGPPPWISFSPGRDESTIEAWAALSTRIGNAKPDVSGPARLSAPGGEVAVQDIEQSNETGLNDTAGTGQFISGFGTGEGDQPFARITGALGAPAPPVPPAECVSSEDDNSISNANDLALDPLDQTTALCSGVIDIGLAGATTGDVDFFAFGTVEAGTLLTIDAGSFDPNAQFAVTTALYSAAGVLLGSRNDLDSTAESVLTVVAPTTGEYFALVAGLHGLPSDPFDPASAPRPSIASAYQVFVGVHVAEQAPCVAIEPDSSISQATVLPFVAFETQPCFGTIGDGPFAQSTGDFDMFALDVDAMSHVVVDVVSQTGQSATPLTTALFDAAGNLLGSQVDDGSGDELFLHVRVVDAGRYFALVSSSGVLPLDPFDESSGTGAGPETAYAAFVLSLPSDAEPPPEPTPTPPGPTPTTGPVQPTTVPTATPAGEPLVGPSPNLAFVTEDDHLVAAAARGVVVAAQAAHDDLLAASVISDFLLPNERCHSFEDDGSIILANPTDVEFQSAIRCQGFIGDGPYATTSGDLDVYSVAVLQGEVLIVDIDAQELGDLDSMIMVLDEEGREVAFNDDFDGLDSRVEWPVTADGTYFVRVGAWSTHLADPFDSSSGTGARSHGPYVMTLARVDSVDPDVDVFLVRLAVGDAISVGMSMAGTVSIVDPLGNLAMSSGGTAAFIYPPDHELGHDGNVGADHVAERAGPHAIVLADGPGSYDGELRIKRAGFADSPGDDVQTVFLDFDGGQFAEGIFDPFSPNDSGAIRTLSPLASYLSDWGLDSLAEDDIIDAAIAEFSENLLGDLQQIGGNGDRQATGLGGELDIEILNSRDHADPWGQPNVSRIIIGGSIAEANISTIGIAQSIDPGNFAAEETAIVLLDLLSRRRGLTNSLNNYDVAAPFTKTDLIGRALGIIAAHEAGHFFGNWHTASSNGVANVMDEGGDLVTTLGIGPDLILGTSDDVDTDFITDEFSRREGFDGDENTTVRSAHALTTGQTNVGAPGPHDVTRRALFSRSTWRWLATNDAGFLEQVAQLETNDIWLVVDAGNGHVFLRDAQTNRYLDADSYGVEIDTSPVSTNGARWRLSDTGGIVRLWNVDHGGYLTAQGADEGYAVVRAPELSTASQWQSVIFPNSS